MLRRIVNPLMIKRFCHTHSKTKFQENVIKPNDATIEKLLKQQNDTLIEINDSLFKVEQQLDSLKVGLNFCLIMSSLAMFIR